MNCEMFREKISRLVDNMLAEDERRSVLEHLSECPECRRYKGELSVIKELLSAKRQVQVPADFDVSTMSRVRKARYAPVLYNVLIGTTAAVLAVFGGMALVGPAPNLSEYHGTVKIFSAKNNRWRLVESPVMLAKGDIVKTFASSGADISINGIAGLRLKPDTELAVGCRALRFVKTDMEYTLNKGQALISHAQGRPYRGDFKIRTSESVSTAVGTGFAVSVFPEAAKTIVGVMDGEVRVASLVDPGAVVSVKEGQKIEITGGVQGLEVLPLDAGEIEGLFEIYQLGHEAKVVLVIGYGANRVRELLKPCMLYIADSKYGKLPDALKTAVVLFNDAMRKNDIVLHRKVIDTFMEIVVNDPLEPYNAQLLLFTGAYYYYIKDYESAIDTFERTAKSFAGKDQAGLALCAEALIYMENLNDSASAAKLFDQVLEQYPYGPEAQYIKQTFPQLPGQN